MTDLDRLAVLAGVPDAEIVLDYLAGTTGGANRPMPTQRQAIDATKRMRAAARERDELREALDEFDPEVIRIMSKITQAMRFDAIPAIAVLAGRKKNDGAAFTLKHLRSLVAEYDTAMAALHREAGT